MHKKPKDFPLTIIFDKENQQILTFKQLEPANVRFVFPFLFSLASLDGTVKLNLAVSIINLTKRACLAELLHCIIL